MYDPDAYTIAAYAAESPEHTFKVGVFVLATINQHFEHVPGILANFKRYGMECKNFTRSQKLSIKQLAAKQQALFDAIAKFRTMKRPEHAALRYMVEYRGFGFVKASFLLQLLIPDIRLGCLDRHNITMYGLSARAFSGIPTSTYGLTSKINTYIKVCENLGGTSTLWNNWCLYLATLRPAAFPTGEAVSKLHVTCILGDDHA